MSVIVPVLILTVAASFSKGGLLSVDQIKDLEENLRGDLINHVVSDLYDAIEESDRMGTDCERKLNDTHDSCTNCKSNSLQPTPEYNIPDVKIGFASKNILKPILGKLVKIKKIPKKVKKVFKSVKHGIKKGIKRIGKGVKNVAKRVVGGVKKVAHKLKKGIKKTLKKAKDIAHRIKKGVRGVGRGVRKAAKRVAGGIKKVARGVRKSVKRGWKKAKAGFRRVRKWFGRRRRSACSVCNKLESDDGKVIISNVCGSTYLHDAANIGKRINNMRLLYESASNDSTTLITKIEINDATAKMDTETYSVNADVKSVEYVVNHVVRNLTLQPGFTATISNMKLAAQKIFPKLYNDFVLNNV